MAIDVTLKIGGEAGQGIQTIGQLLALVCREAGLYILGINDFESRIRGGHNFFQLRIGDAPVRAPGHRVDILVALDKNTVQLHKNQVVSGGLIMSPQEHEDIHHNSITVPFFDLARQAGSLITANTVAAGAVLSVLKAPFSLFETVLRKQFSGKELKVLE